MTQERLAYRAAWRVRRRTGNESTDVLAAELLSRGAEPIWLDPDSELHTWLFDCWRRGVGPVRLPFEAMRKASSFVPRVFVQPLREIRRYLGSD